MPESGSAPVEGAEEDQPDQSQDGALMAKAQFWVKPGGWAPAELVWVWERREGIPEGITPHCLKRHAELAGLRQWLLRRVGRPLPTPDRNKTNN